LNYGGEMNSMREIFIESGMEMQKVTRDSTVDKKVYHSEEMLIKSASSGEKFATLNNLIYSVIRTQSTNGSLEVYQTLGFTVTSEGWRTYKWYQPEIFILSMTEEYGILDKWTAINALPIGCGDDSKHHFARKDNVEPNWFDALEAVSITIRNGTFTPC